MTTSSTSNTSTSTPLRIGIVGSGIAGLSAAWILGQKHNVTLFEKHANPGMGAFNLEIFSQGGTLRIDVPIRAFNTSYYKNLTAMYQHIGVEMQHTDHSAAFAHPDLKKAFFDYRYLNIGDRAFPFLKGLGSLNLKTLSILKDVTRFLIFARLDQRKGRTVDMTISEYLDKKKYSAAFVDDILLPCFAAICTCSYKAVKNYPAEIIIGFLGSGLLSKGIWRAKKGADDAINKMLENCDNLVCNSAVSRVSNTETGAEILFEGGLRQQFDRVVIATQANQALEMIGDEFRLQAALLSRVQYEKSEVVVHSDTSLLPKGWEQQAPVSFMVDHKQNRPMASIWLNKIYPELEGDQAYFQTWHPLIKPKPETILGQSWFERPVVTAESLNAIKTLADLQTTSEPHVYFCGSYAMPGIPLLESGVQSSMLIGEALDSPAPWNAD